MFFFFVIFVKELFSYFLIVRLYFICYKKNYREILDFFRILTNNFNVRHFKIQRKKYVAHRNLKIYIKFLLRHFYYMYVSFCLLRLGALAQTTKQTLVARTDRRTDDEWIDKHLQKHFNFKNCFVTVFPLCPLFLRHSLLKSLSPKKKKNEGKQ